MEMINGRTAEEIKRNLSYLVRCEICPQNHEYGCDYEKRTKECQTTNDALALIERLEEAQPRWISVEERLPRCGERVLVCNGGSVWEAYLSISHKWVRHEFLWAIDVTHWMQLPEPPKGADK